MRVTYVDRCTACSCSSLRDEGGHRPLPGVVGCGRACRCHAPLNKACAGTDVPFRFWRRPRAAGQGAAAVR